MGALVDPGQPSKPRQPELPTHAFPRQRDWERWLSANHATSQGIWMRISKSSAGSASTSYGEALEVALCYGWIDGQKAALDDHAWLQRFTPRRPKSRWSKSNRAKAEALMAQGLMTPAGQAEVDRAKRDGRWAAAYDGSARAKVPADLQTALNENPKAAEFFETLDSRNRYAILYRVQDAKKPETRARRIARFVEMLTNGERIHS